jgi:hypothetical protein
MEQSIAKAVVKDYKLLKISQPIFYLTKAFARHNYVIITGESNDYYICDSKIMLSNILENK